MFLLVETSLCLDLVCVYAHLMYSTLAYLDWECVETIAREEKRVDIKSTVWLQINEVSRITIP
jgi:hypothetical protein